MKKDKGPIMARQTGAQVDGKWQHENSDVLATELNDSDINNGFACVHNLDNITSRGEIFSTMPTSLGAAPRGYRAH